jgi:uncharacterized protein (DUF952 family)
VSRIYKILADALWREALVKGRFEGAGIDITDGYIHFSAKDQVGETARRYFRDQPGLVVLEVEADDLGPELKWEPARDGELFPHLYGPLSCARVVAVHPAPVGPDGAPDLAWLRT